MKRETGKDSSRDLITQRGKRGRNALVTAEDRALVDAPDISDQPLAWPKSSGFSGMFTFRYSCTEIYSQDGNIHVRSKQTRYQDGRLTSEECEGTLDGRAYDRMVSEAQGLFLSQLGNFMKLLYAPFAARSRRHDE
ncbi:MAG TPA: hypothetical protein VGE12_00050 [Noviherbaspirillum sp.]